MSAHEHPWSSYRDGQPADRVLQLAVAEELARIYADVLQDPPPPELLRLIERLESQASSQDG